MDLIGATKAAKQLSTDPAFASSAPFAKKADWNTQITGAYNLMFPHMHKDFALRLEVMAYVAERITSAFTIHNSSNKHFGLGSIDGVTIPAIPTTIVPIPSENFIFKKYISKNGITSSSLQVKR